MNKKIRVPRWDEKYSVGNERIDHQHHYFLNLIEYLSGNIDSISPKEYEKNLLDEVLLYARFHFRSEENMMMLHRYPDYERHKRLHEDLLHDLTQKITHFSIKKADLSEIVDFLTEWFLIHTVNEDKKFHTSLLPEIQ